MMKRMTFLAMLATATLLAGDAQAQSSANFFSSFTQRGTGTPFSYTRTSPGMGGPLPALIEATAQVDFRVNNASYLSMPGPTIYDDVTFKLIGESSAMATTTVIGSTTLKSQDGFSGMFSIMSGGTNLLSGTFTEGTLLQTASNEAALSIGLASFSSDIFLPLTDERFTLSLSGPFGSLIPDSGAFQDFDAGVSSTFTAAVIPEPATLAMAGLGVLGLPMALRIARRRRTATSS